MGSILQHRKMLLLLFLSLSEAQVPPESCCTYKQVGEVEYTLVGPNDTKEWGCKDNCIYTSPTGGRVCFKSGSLPVTCKDSGSGWGGNGTEGGGGGSWPQEPEVQYNYTAKGKMIDLDTNMKGYIVGSGNKVVVWNHDSFGLTSAGADKRMTKEWADYLAEEGGYTVLIPDWFRGNNNPGPFPTVEWMSQVTNWTTLESDWNNVVLPFLENRESGPLSIGLIGTCWGSYPVVLLSRFSDIRCGISMHPSHDKLLPLSGQNETEVLSKIVAPQLFMIEGSYIGVGVRDSVKPGGIADQILGDKIVIEEFPDMAHGWTVGGNMNDPKIARDVERAKTLALDFLKKYL